MSDTIFYCFKALCKSLENISKVIPFIVKLREHRKKPHSNAELLHWAAAVMCSRYSIKTHSKSAWLLLQNDIIMLNRAVTFHTYNHSCFTAKKYKVTRNITVEWHQHNYSNVCQITRVILISLRTTTTMTMKNSTLQHQPTLEFINIPTQPHWCELFSGLSAVFIPNSPTVQLCQWWSWLHAQLIQPSCSNPQYIQHKASLYKKTHSQQHRIRH